METDTEFWKIINVPGCAGDYEISSRGRMRRFFPKTKYAPEGSIHYLKIVARPTPRGYLRVSVGIGGRRWIVARLMLLTFVGPPPSDEHQAAHWDGDSANNRIENLRWATQTENEADKFRYGIRPYKWETHCPCGREKDGVTKSGKRFCTACHGQFGRRVSELEREVALLKVQILALTAKPASETI